MNRALAWWFLLYMGGIYGGAPSTVGPFRNADDCNQVRQYVRETKRSAWGFSWCWWDGRQP